MAYGFICTHCGRQELPHQRHDQDAEGEENIIPGYTYSLATCPGFTYSQEDIDYLIREGLSLGGPPVNHCSMDRLDW